MDTLNIILLSAGAFGLLGLAYLGGYDLGQAHGSESERTLANRRVNALLEELNKYKPRATRRRGVSK
mgnify:CR=1 FL=1